MGWIEYQSELGTHRRDYDDDDLEKINLSHRKIVQIDCLDRLTNLQILDLSNNLITKIECLDRLTNLQILDLSNNLITKIECLDRLTNLQTLDLSRNKITGIENLDRLTNLQSLHLYGNRISRIEKLDRLTNLQGLRLSNNQISRIENLDRLTDLQELYLHNNQISRIENLNRLTNLQTLFLHNNQITRIENLDRLTNLQTLWLNDNPINVVPMTIMLLRHLTTLYVDPEINPIIRRFLTRNQIKTKKTIYQDGQNVHDTEINRSITDSLYRLMEQKTVLSEEMVIQEIIGDHILTDPVKEALVEYVKIQDVHSKLNVTFFEALCYVWTTVRQHKATDEIKRILDQEMRDSICRCFTGRLSRLVNCLNGFDDRVMVKISDQQELANLIISIRQKTDSLEEQQQMVQKEMSDRGYDEQTIREWLGYLG
jgi:hypothetical protein